MSQALRRKRILYQKILLPHLLILFQLIHRSLVPDLAVIYYIVIVTVPEWEKALFDQAAGRLCRRGNLRI